MAVPTLALTFQDLMLRVAEFLGIADYSGGAAAIPTEAHDLDLAKRVVNDGYRRFINSHPKGQWQFLTPLYSLTLSGATTGVVASATNNTVVDATRSEADDYWNGQTILITSGTGAGQYRTISDFVKNTNTITVSAIWTTNPDSTSGYQIVAANCIEGDNSRYAMPDGFVGRVLAPWTYSTIGIRTTLRTCQDARIRAVRAVGSSSGVPSLIAYRPLSVGVTTTTPRWEAILWPTPAMAYVIQARVELYPDKLVNNDDRPICGFQFDEALLAAVMAEAERQRDDTLGIQEANWQAALIRAVTIDMQAAPRRLGSYRDHSDEILPHPYPKRYWGVDTYNNLPV